MPRRSSRLALKYPAEVPSEPEVAVQANPVLEIPVEPTPIPTPVQVPVHADPVVITTQQQINNEVVARIHMFNRNIDVLTSKITDLTVALEEIKKKKKKRSLCSLM